MGVAAQVTTAIEELEETNKGKEPPKKKQRTSKELAQKPSDPSGDDAGESGELSAKKLKKELKKIIATKNLETITLKDVRAELETTLGLAGGALDERKSETKKSLPRWWRTLPMQLEQV